MAKTSRQTAIFGVQDWKKIYQTYSEADLQSYDFETLRKTFIDYLRLYYPETFNDYIESSEFIALLDVMAFMGQALAFRNDLNTRENFIDTAERRDSVVRLAQLVGYTAKRNEAAQGYLKVFNVSTTENVVDYNGNNLSNVTVNWNDLTNPDWQEQFTAIINAALVDAQRIGRAGNSADILGIATDEYTINLLQGYLPVVPFTSVVDGVNMAFEVVSATSQGRDYIYEPAPRPNGEFNVLYRNDRMGFGSPNTGFFFYFKQGVLQNQDFNLSERVSNRTVNLGVEGVNNQDVWLYQLDDVGNIDTEWEQVENIYAAAAEQNAPDTRNIFSVDSRTNDQVDLIFGDGIFSNIPVGIFRSYLRASNGLEYIINEEEIQSVEIPISYISRTGRLETITFTVGLTSPVSNARTRESIVDIKSRAPARFYTQNRMVNGEDYTNFPYTQYGSIIKSSAINRSTIGASRYLDLVDVTGKYSSTNTFSSDGVLYEQNTLPTSSFTWTDNNDIADAIENIIEPSLISRGMTQFYYANFRRPTLSTLNLTWQQSTTLTNETTGYFKDASGTPKPVGFYASDNLKYVTVNCLIKFGAPAGYYFDQYNQLQVGVATGADEKETIWATVNEVVLDGTNNGVGNLADGSGPVSLNNFVPTRAIPLQVIPVFVTDLPIEIQQEMTTQIQLYRNFGLGYDINGARWYIITAPNLAIDQEFSLTYAGNTQGVGLDASWLVQCVTDGEIYTVTSRNKNYYFASVIQNRFFFDGAEQVYDPKTGTVINDFVNVLKSNSRPDSNLPLPSDVRLDIIDQPIQADGFVDDFQVIVSFTDSDADGIADNPDFFEEIVQPQISPSNKLVFLQRTVDFDNLERYLPVDSGVVNSRYATKDDIELAKAEYVEGTIFYATSQRTFWTLVINTSGVRTLTPRNDFIARTGRQDLAFQYRHNSPLSRRIDPGTTNIIDVYVVTNGYYNSYINWIRDTTNTVPEPTPPTITELTTAYAGLQRYKMLSDSVIINSVTFKPLFGVKAPLELQATIKVVKSQSTTISTTEVKSRVITSINQYFTIDKWDFGTTFFFSELASYVHEQIGDIVSSVVLVPKDPTKRFGDLYEIRSAPNEILISAATVNDVEVVEALTATVLRTASSNDEV